jgi:hypothetical protein
MSAFPRAARGPLQILHAGEQFIDPHPSEEGTPVVGVVVGQVPHPGKGRGHGGVPGNGDQQSELPWKSRNWQLVRLVSRYARCIPLKAPCCRCLQRRSSKGSRAIGLERPRAAEAKCNIEC